MVLAGGYNGPGKHFPCSGTGETPVPLFHSRCFSSVNAITLISRGCVKIITMPHLRRSHRLFWFAFATNIPRLSALMPFSHSLSSQWLGHPRPSMDAQSRDAMFLFSGTGGTPVPLFDSHELTSTRCELQITSTRGCTGLWLMPPSVKKMADGSGGASVAERPDERRSGILCPTMQIADNVLSHVVTIERCEGTGLLIAEHEWSP